MPRFSFEDADKYGSKGGNGGSFFSLKDDGDTARVQFLGDDMNDFPGYAVHEVPVGDRTRYVNCLREYGDPIDVCPFCASRDKDIAKVKAKLFIPLYNIDDGEVQMWERGKTFFRDLSSYCARTPKVSTVVTEIERKGKAKDPSTTYGLYELRDQEPERKLSDFEDDEIPEVLGRYVLDKTAEDMEYYLKRGDFPDDSADDEVVTRRSRRDEEPSRTSRSRGSKEEF